MKVEITVPKEVIEKIEKIGNKTKQKSAYKIYNALLRKSRHKNTPGYFEISSKYLIKINGRYKTIIKYFIDNDIIEPLIRVYSEGEQWGDLFEKVEKVSYSANYGKCIHYRFNPNLNIEEGEIKEIEFEDPTLDKRWYKILKDSIERLGYDSKISRDGFGGRVYHSLIPVYKDELHQRGYCVIDAKTSQPRLLYLIMKERGVIDPNYFSIFESNDDFYLTLVNKFNMKNREEAKELFMYWALGNGYTQGFNMYKEYPVATKFLKNLKSTNYKDASRCLAFKESRIFIDNLLEHLPVTFGITIHDSIIVRKNDANVVLKYCKDKYPDLRFSIEEL